MFVGRMSPDKGVHRAVDIAKRTGMPLVIAAKMWEEVEVDYFRAEVEPRLHDRVELLLDADRERRLELLGRAEALLNPICWAEPFGLVMAEALACGTPVVGSPYGAAPEIVDDGVTGFLRESDDALVEALGRLGGWTARRAGSRPSRGSRSSGWPAITSGSTTGWWTRRVGAT